MISHFGIIVVSLVTLWAGAISNPVHINKASGALVAGTDIKLDQSSAKQVSLTLSDLTDQAVAEDLKEFNELSTQRTLSMGSNSSLGNVSPVLPSRPDGLRGDIQSYTIKKGDTISAVAAAYGITTDTILQSNKISDPWSIKPGQEILILPVSGSLHVVTSSDTIDSIARKYHSNKEQILSVNDIDASQIKEGAKIIVPGQPNATVKKAVGATTARFIKPVGKGMFVKPASGRCFNGRHMTAIDCPGAYGQSVWAAAAGTVTMAINSCPPNYSTYKGFCAMGGNLVVIKHGNGFETHYAHNSSVYVRPGQQVQKGQVIAGMGCSGITRGGPNGNCAIHVHFEIRQNGYRYNPLRFL